MLPVRILNPQFELQGEIDDYQSLLFTRRHFCPGEFELHLSMDKDNGSLVEDNIILLGANGHKSGIILYRGIDLNENGDEKLVIKGYTLQGLMKRRVTVPGASGYDRIIGAAETIMKHYVDANCINPTDNKRIISQLINNADQARGMNTPWQTRYQKLDEVLKAIAEFCDMGWEVYLDTVQMKWVFDVVPGRILTADQDLLPPVIFSIEFDNIVGQKYAQNSMDYVNLGYAGGKGDEGTRLIQSVGNSSGLDRREDFFDCSNAQDATELISEGNKKLADKGKAISLEASVISTSFIYGADWDIGDVVTVQNRKWGVTMNTRITEVRETYEADREDIEVVFGNEIPNLIKKINNATQKNVR